MSHPEDYHRRPALSALAETLNCPQRAVQPLASLGEDQLHLLDEQLQQARQQHRQQLRSALQQSCPLPLRPLLTLWLRRSWP